MMRRWQGMWSPPSWAEELDFVGPRVSASPWAWLLLLGGLVALGVVLPKVQEVSAQQAEAQATLKRLQRAVHQQALAAKAPKGPQSPVRKADVAPTLSPESARHAAQMAQWLGYPWLDVLAQVEEAAHAEQAVMLGFNLDLATLGSRPDSAPEVRLSAAVRDDASALRWVQAQGSLAQLLSRERLETPFASAAGNYEWRAQALLSGVSP